MMEVRRREIQRSRVQERHILEVTTDHPERGGSQK